MASGKAAVPSQVRGREPGETKEDCPALIPGPRRHPGGNGNTPQATTPPLPPCPQVYSAQPSERAGGAGPDKIYETLIDLGKKFESLEKKVNYLLGNKQITEKAESACNTNVVEHNMAEMDCGVEGGDGASEETTTVQGKECAENNEAEQCAADMKGEKEPPKDCVSMACNADNVREVLDKCSASEEEKKQDL